MQVDGGRPLSDTLPLRRGLEAALPEIAADLADEVRVRTQTGHDVSGYEFEPKRDGEPSNLHQTGAMVASFKPLKVTDRGFVLGIRDRKQRAKAKMHQDGIGALFRREWIGLDEDQVERFAERVVDSEIPPDRQRGNQ